MLADKLQQAQAAVQHAVAAAQNGDWQAARNAFGNAVQLGLDDIDIIRNYAVSCVKSNAFVEAAQAYRNLVDHAAADDKLRLEAAGVFMDCGWFADAESVLRKCAREVPVLQLLCRSILMQDAASVEKIAEAEKLINFLAGKISGYDELMQKGALAHRRNNNTLASKYFRMAVSLRPNDFAALSNLARVQKAGRDAAGFADTARAICRIRPDCEWLTEDLGEERPGHLADTEIEQLIRTAIEHKASAANWNGLAKYYQSRLKLHAAKLAFEKALLVAAGTPDEVKLNWNKSLLHLLMGEFEAGRELYESRLDLSGMIHVSKIMPQWQGESLQGKTLMIYSEQGMGDVIQFARFVPLVKQLYGGKIILVVQKPLMALFKYLHGVDEVLEYVPGVAANQICAYDYAVAILSLPHKMNLVYPQYPRQAYLDSAKVEVAAPIKQAIERIACDKRMKIGFCSSGNPELPRTKLRDCQIEYFQQLLNMDEYLWVNLNRNMADADFGENAINCIGEVQNFGDTAALVDACDLVISVDTAIVHLAGALGKPVWLLLFYESEWRWGVNVEDNYWYPTMRIFRQPYFGDWQDCIDRIKKQLAEK